MDSYHYMSAEAAKWSGAFNGTYPKYATAVLDYELRQNYDTNKTWIKVNLRIIRNKTGSTTHKTSTPWYIKIGGATVASGNFNFDITSVSAGSYIWIGSGEITYDNDASTGELAAKAISAKFDVSGTSLGTATPSGTLTIPTIPRASSIANVPDFTAPNAVTCNITRLNSAFTHTVYLDVCDTAGTWWKCGEYTGQGASATFNDVATMRYVFSVLSNSGQTGGGGSCKARFRIQTYNGTTAIGTQKIGGEGIVRAPGICTCNAPGITIPNSANATVSKPCGDFNVTYSTNLNGYSIGSGSGITGTSLGLNTSGTNAITALAQTGAKNYTITLYTYYSDIYLGTTTATGTVYAPAVDRVSAPNWTLGHQFSSAVTTDNSAFTRSAILQLQDSSNNWHTVASRDNNNTTTYYWDGVVEFWNAAFPIMGSRSSCNSRILITSYYNGVQIQGANVTTYGTCYAPAVTTCSTPTWTAGGAFTCNFSRSLPCLTHNVTLQVKNSANNFVTVETYSGSSDDTIYFINSTALNTSVFNLLAQAGSRETIIYVDTYYGNTKIQSTWSKTGTVTAPNASTCATTPNWIGGDSLALTISRNNSAFTHTVEIKVNSQTITTATGIGTSMSFGTSAAERIKIYNALAQTSSKTSEVIVTTYYNGVQVRTAVSAWGVCYSPSPVTPSVPTWTAGNSFSSTITLSKDYLVYSIQLKVGTQDIQSYSYQTATTLGFAGTAALNLLAYKGLNGAASATSQFIVTMYYPKGDGTYVQVGPSATTNGTCTALEASTITAPNWTAGSTFTATITKKSLNLYEIVRLKVNGELVQEYPIQGSTSLTYALTFANTKDINTKIYSALAQTASKTATLEITTYFGTDTTNIVQVRSTVVATGSCNASEAVVGNLTLSQTPAIIDNTEIICNLTKALSDYTVVIDVSCNGVAITSLTPADAATSALFNSADYINELYQSIPTQKSGSLQFKVITYYNGIQVQQPKTVAVDINANETTVKVKIDEAVMLTTKANVFTEVEKVFIDNTSMIASKLSNLAISIAKGYFYLENKYGGYITQIKAQISNSSGMMQTFNFTSGDAILNNEKTRIVSSAFLGDDAIIMGPYDFMDVTTAGTVYNLNIIATDSRGYSVTKTIPLKIFPYSAPTIKLDKKETKRGTGDENKYFIINLNGTISSLFTESTGEKVQTNLIDTLSLEYKIYGSTGKYSIYNITLYTYNDTYTAYNLNKFSTAGKGIADFDIASTYELKVTVKDAFGKTNSDSIIILPDRPALSFRDQRLGINIIPRKLGEFIERESGDEENPSLDVNGYIYSNGREVPTFVVLDEWTI